MNPKKVVKSLIFFAKREFSQKRPLKVRVLRVKNAAMFTKGGPLKVLNVQKAPDALYLVLVEYKEELRIYYYSKEGRPLGAQNFDRDQTLVEKLQKATVNEFEFQKQV